MADDDVGASVPCHGNARLHASWRAGEEIMTCELRNQERGEHGDRPFVASVHL
jgi:hypothetical protein